MAHREILVVFCHGYLGFVSIVGVEYFRGLREHLSKRFPDVQFLFPQVSPSGTIRDRARELYGEIQKRVTAQSEVYLIGHSMGGLDARFLVSPKGLALEGVKAVITVSTPHHGSSIADIFYSGADNMSTFFLGRDHFKVLPHKEGLKDLRTEDMKRFNGEVLDNPHTRYVSYAGSVGFSTQGGGAPFSIFYPLYSAIHEREGENDGLVSVSSAKWGEFQEVLKANHIEQVGWDISIVNYILEFGKTAHFKHKEFYSSLVTRFVLGKQ